MSILRTLEDHFLSEIAHFFTDLTSNSAVSLQVELTANLITVIQEGPESVSYSPIKNVSDKSFAAPKINAPADKPVPVGK